MFRKYIVIYTKRAFLDLDQYYYFRKHYKSYPFLSIFRNQ